MHAEIILELAYLLADGWLGDLEALGRSSEVQLLSNGDEISKMSKVHGWA